MCFLSKPTKPRAWSELPEWEQTLHCAGNSTGAGIIGKIPFWKQRWEVLGSEWVPVFSEHPESVSGVGFRVLTCISEIRAQGSCFQTWLSVGLEQLVGNGGRPAQQRGDKACQLSHLAKAGKRWSACTCSPFHWGTILGVHWQSLFFSNWCPAHILIITLQQNGFFSSSHVLQNGGVVGPWSILSSVVETSAALKLVSTFAASCHKQEEICHRA